MLDSLVLLSWKIDHHGYYIFILQYNLFLFFAAQKRILDRLKHAFSFESNTNGRKFGLYNGGQCTMWMWIVGFSGPQEFSFLVMSITRQYNTICASMQIVCVCDVSSKWWLNIMSVFVSIWGHPGIHTSYTTNIYIYMNISCESTYSTRTYCTRCSSYT